MKASQRCINMIKQFEGFCGTAYKCVSTEEYYTIGYGHYSKNIKKGQKITKDDAEKLLIKDIAKFEKHVNSYDDKYKWSQNEFDALVSFCFNVGSINQLTADGSRSKAEIASKILSYNKSGGRVLPGLTTRRRNEQMLFLTKDPDIESYLNCIKEVFAGSLGNGSDRKTNIEKIGLDYNKVQKIVNILSH